MSPEMALVWKYAKVVLIILALALASGVYLVAYALEVGTTWLTPRLKAWIERGLSRTEGVKI